MNIFKTKISTGIMVFLSIILSLSVNVSAKESQLLNNYHGNIGAISKVKIDTTKEIKINSKLGSDLLQLSGKTEDSKWQSKDDLIENLKLSDQIKEEGSSIKGISKKITEDTVHVYIRYKSDDAIKVIENICFTIDGYDRKNKILTAWVGISKLESLESLEDVINIQTVDPPVFMTGSSLTEGDGILKSDLVRALGADYNGKNIKIGVLSDGVTSLAQSVSTGDLPSNVHVLSNSLGGDEGTAMLEIIHDIAPGAELYFHDAGSSYINFMSGIDKLVEAGCKIIIDDVSWLNQPYFDDGPIAQHVSYITKNSNVLYISAAGNFADRHYQGGFYSDSAVPSFHDFSEGRSSYDKDLYIRVRNGESIGVFLQWDDEFGHSGNDYDLILFDLAYGQIISTSAFVQSGNGDPYERIVVKNNSGENRDVAVWVCKKSGATRNLEVYISGGIVDSVNIKPADSIFGHQASAETIAVGTVNASAPNTIAYYSSRGPVTLRNGEIRQVKPDICGVDGVRITGAGGFYNPFYGTSAASPHIAAIASLVWSKYPTKTNAEIQSLLLQYSTDLGASGPDNDYGYGRADALTTINNAKVSIFSLKPDKGSPQAINSRVTWKCNTTGDNLLYQFWVYTESTGWQIKQAYSSSNTFVWRPSATGNCRVAVWVKEATSTTTTFDKDFVADYTVQAAPLTVTSLMPDSVSPGPANAKITWTCNAIGGTSPLLYQFWVYSESTGWQIKQAYSSSDTCVWTTPSTIGFYRVAVWVKETSSATTTFDKDYVADYTVQATPVTVTSLLPDHVSPQPANMPITWTCNAMGGTSPLLYQFWVYSEFTGWQIKQAYSSSDTFVWTTPSTIGFYRVAVWVKETSSATTTFDKDYVADYTVQATPVTVTSLLPDHVSPQSANIPITWTCNAIGGTSPLLYQFWVYSESTDWQIKQAYSSNNTFAWTPTTAGNYRIAVWAKETSSATGTFDKDCVVDYVIQAPAAQPVSITSLVPAPASPQPANTPITWTCNATGGTTPLQYMFFVYSESTDWQIKQAYSSNNTFTWTPTATGNYRIAVWVKETSSTTGTFDKDCVVDYIINTGI